MRPEEVELEGRSRGLQWFFSFFLVFLVESGGEHSECILLLDEPGLSLHPLAQLDLIKFFASLSKDNQIIYTTHSPFLVNPDNLSEVRAVYVDEKGKSLISSNLRQNEDVASKSIYPIHAAIGLTVSETLLLGCLPVLVEGPSDQIYLQLIKNHLIESSDYKPGRETVFIPSGGVKGMSSIISIVMGREGELPHVVLDSDAAGASKEKSLRENLYNKEQDKLITIREVAGDGFEVEDLLPKELIAQAFSRRFRARKGEDFDRIRLTDEPIVAQIERFATENGIDLELGWKVEVAREFQRIFRANPAASEQHQETWGKIFSRISS
ncbi:MAG: AAA family ATPase [Pyrinomonadaceae bacterium]